MSFLATILTTINLYAVCKGNFGHSDDKTE